jgi:hypothetical protein
MAHKIWTMLLFCSMPLQLHGAEAASYSTYWHEGLGREMLVATVDGQDYWITDDEDLGADFPLSGMVMIDIEEQGDFDADGFRDVLFTANAGGSSSIPRYYVASHLGDSFFHVSSAAGLQTYASYKLIDVGDGLKKFKVYYSFDDVDHTTRVDGYGIYELRRGKLNRIADVTNHAKIPVALEIRSSDFHDEWEQSFTFDVDGDGKLDTLNCTYWQRWGDIGCDMELSLYGEISQSWGADQLGVALSKTNGVHDLVYEWVGLMKFNKQTLKWEVHK